MPAIFVTDRHAYTTQDEVGGVTTPLGNLVTFFAEAPDSRIRPDLGGQPIGWADPDPRGKAGSDRATSSIRIGLDRPVLDGANPIAVKAELEAARRPAFYPRVEHAFVIDETTAALVGGDGSATKVRYATSWLQHGNESGNPGLAFHTLVTPATVEKSGNGSGLVCRGHPHRLDNRLCKRPSDPAFREPQVRPRQCQVWPEQGSGRAVGLYPRGHAG